MESKVSLGQLEEHEFQSYLEFRQAIAADHLDATLSKQELLARAVTRLHGQVVSLHRYVYDIRGHVYDESQETVPAFDQMSLECLLEELPVCLNDFANSLFAINVDLWSALTVRHIQTRDDDFDGPDEVDPDEMSL